jgi:hypothetical protein
MAIKSFKEIVDNKAYRINAKDREIFEQGTLQSFFGFSDSDMIEFILYDANDNQLPQGDYSELTRYIPLSTQNIKDYILLPEGTYLQAFQFPKEYFIDVERLIKEAGYNNGIFKTQITLLNKRVGFESPNEKLWIKEISPSRTEVKLLPLKNEVSKKTDLLQRFNVMTNGNDFRDDVVPYIAGFIESINPSEIDSFIQKIYSEAWYNKLVSEFGIAGFDLMTTKIYNKFVEAIKYEFSNRVSNINDVNYGNIKSTTPSLQLDKNDVFKIAERILVECVELYLPNRRIQSQTEVDTVFDESIDKVGKILERKESDVIINPKEAVVEITKKKTIPTKELELERVILQEVPSNMAVPTFKTPNPVKSTTKQALTTNKVVRGSLL